MDQSVLPPFKSSPMRAIQAVVSSPNWVANVLWLSLGAMLGSVFIGTIGIFGYGAELIQHRAGRPENPSIDVDSNRLGDYISKGIWPFLVQFLVQLAATFLIMVPLGFLGLIIAAAGSAGGDEAVGALAFLLVPVVFVLSLATYLITTPFLIRAMVCQDFQRAFDMGWCLNFAKMMAGEIIVSGIIFGLLSMCIMIVGYIALCVGAIPAMGIIMGGYVNLLAQWYEIYLSKGGEPAPAGDGMEDIVDATIV